MNVHVTEALLFCYFAGKASVLQKQLIDEWVREPANLEQFYAALEVWENQHPQYIPDVQSARERHQNRISSQRDGTPIGDRSIPASPFIIRRAGLLGMIAASVLLLVVGWLQRDRVMYRTYRTGYAQIRHLRLADGSRVTLNANSCLKEPRFDLGSNARIVQLTGEADFSVTHTADSRRFVVETERGLDVLVLGTEFTVYSRPLGDRVVLRKGRVQLTYPKGQTTQSMLMKPGDLVRLDLKGQISRQAVRQPENYALWRSNRFVFDRTTLREIAQLFKETYGIQLIINDPELAQWTVSGAFTAQSADELIETLAQASGLTYTRHKNQVIITLPQDE